MRDTRKTRHDSILVDGVEIFYRHAGDPTAPAILMLHGDQGSSHMFRKVIEPLAEVAHVVAPDLPSFGFSSTPPMGEYDYTFENLSRTIERFVDAIGLHRFVLYVFDWGAPVGYHIATRSPDRILGLVVQNGNAHDEGLGPPWDAPKAYWADPTPENREAIPDWLDFESTRAQYVGEQPERLRSLYPPETWHLDWERLSRPGNTEIQFQLFTDYQHHVARFPEIAAYHREHQPPCLLLWGRHDGYFDIAEVLAYHRVLDTLEAHLFDGGHQLLETHHRECAALIAEFITALPTAARA